VSSRRSEQRRRGRGREASKTARGREPSERTTERRSGERVGVGPAALMRTGLCPAAAGRSPAPGRSVPVVFRWAGPCRPAGVAGSPGTAWLDGLGRPGHASSRAGPCLGRAKKTGRVPGCRALGCMLIYTRRRHSPSVRVRGAYAHRDYLHPSEGEKQFSPPCHAPAGPQ
jgi:hypothetical protein